MKNVEPLNIFDDIVIEARRKEKVETDASIADTIAHQLIRSIEDKWDEDPIFFEKFSKLIQPTIADFHKGRAPPVAVTVRYCGCISVAHLRAQAARQLPDQSTTLRVESSSTDDSRLPRYFFGPLYSMPPALFIASTIARAHQHGCLRGAEMTGGYRR
jgi:hypothetical protein